MTYRRLSAAAGNASDNDVVRRREIAVNHIRGIGSPIHRVDRGRVRRAWADGRRPATGDTWRTDGWHSDGWVGSVGAHRLRASTVHCGPETILFQTRCVTGRSRRDQL